MTLTLAELGTITKAGKPVWMSDETWSMPNGPEKSKRIAQEKHSGPRHVEPDVPHATYTQKVNEASAKGYARGAEEAVGQYQGKYRPDRWSRLADMRKVKGRYKVAAVGALGAGALMASPANKRNLRKPGETKQEEKRRNLDQAKRAAIGAGAGAAVGQGAYSATGYGGHRLFGISQYGGRDLTKNPQAHEINEHITRAGGPEKGFATMPHHIQGGGASKFFNRYYGPGKFGRRAKMVMGTGALVGAGLAAGKPDFRERGQGQGQGRRPSLRLLQGGRAA